jgi:hypothetical protein
MSATSNTTSLDEIVHNSKIELEECDWMHLPTKIEYLKLVQGKYHCLTPEKIEGCYSCNVRSNGNDRKSRQRIEELKKMCRDQVKLISWEYRFPVEQYKDEEPRLQEQVIRDAITKCSKKTFERNQPNMWIELAANLSEEGWTSLWQNMDVCEVMECNWLLHLIEKEAKAKQEAINKAYNEANVFAKVIGWY